MNKQVLFIKEAKKKLCLFDSGAIAQTYWYITLFLCECLCIFKNFTEVYVGTLFSIQTNFNCALY